MNLNSDNTVELPPNATKKKGYAPAFPLLCVFWPTGGAVVSSGRIPPPSGIIWVKMEFCCTLTVIQHLHHENAALGWNERSD